MAERGGKNMGRQLGAESALVEKGLIDDPELIGREAEKRVARLIKKSPLVRRKIIVIIGGPKQTDDQILAAQAAGVKALYGYWQDK
ncbi:MAG: hypothetical protein A3A32_02870 [Candidatus Wildermuthbacteria bacterium RIFCSPLOWO2_01_FULL_48_35]|uniref:Uncharacterized protein n=1 Tax=Candidatus Wildermuthbacteria bacterium RIFCSPLOWO2_01_FULL_48_35 TaxID=1802463 RepID=A0A1G2RRZ8_9BACT|nr:MAG: hypothetical protein A3A32_02870 [Candidatus Wildermuthbacteria bacterium RIFCSPLOWO2_01_FULL_48_35]